MVESGPVERRTRRRRFSRPIAWALRVAWAGWLSCAVAEGLIVFWDVESVLVTGPIILLLALIGIILAWSAGYRALALLGLANALICLLFFSLVISLNWKPPDAKTPFAIMGFLYTLSTLPIACWLTQRAPGRPNPWECLECGYLLYGLTEPRCPECGRVFDPAVLNTIHPPISS